MLILTSQFAKRVFAEGSRPSASTIRRWIIKGVIPGRRIGYTYYVDWTAYLAGGDPLVAKVLRNEPPAA